MGEQDNEQSGEHGIGRGADAGMSVLDRESFAWEILRRRQDYAAHAGSKRTISRATGPHRLEVIEIDGPPGPWGLQFR